MKKPGVPPVPREGQPRTKFDEAVKEILESLMGQRGARVKPLPRGASMDEIIERVNELIDALQ